MALRMLGPVVLLGLLFAGACKRQAPAETTPPPAPAALPAPGAPGPAPAPGPTPAALPPDYDPSALVRGGAPPLEVYAKEPRAPAWADRVEAALGAQMTRDQRHVVPEARGVGLSCHALSCLILVDAPADKMEIALEAVTLVTLGPVTENLGPSPDGKGQVLFLTEPRFADAGKFIAWYEGVRKRTLAALRSGKEPTALPTLPPD